MKHKQRRSLINQIQSIYANKHLKINILPNFFIDRSASHTQLHNEAKRNSVRALLNQVIINKTEHSN